LAISVAQYLKKNIIIHLFQTRIPYNRHNRTTQQHGKWLTITHYRMGVWTQPTLIGAKHSNNTPVLTSFTHHNIGIQQWERNEGILTTNFEVNS